jgi:putative xylitol transport system permease protein
VTSAISTPVPPPRGRVGAVLGTLLSRYGVVVAFVVLCVALSLLNPYFLTPINILNVLRQASINGILAIGLTFVILTGGIDLSIGSVLAFCGIAGAALVTGIDPGSPAAAIALGLGAGLAFGMVNGALVAHLRVPPFVATLGMLSAARGLTFIYNNGMPVPNLSPSFLFIGQGFILGIPVPVLLLAAVVLLAWVVLRFTTYGRYVYAVGGNERSARTSGIDTRRIVFSVYAISGLLAGLAGLVLAARTTSALPQAGVAYELDAIAAVVIGGTSLTGGVGSPIGTLFGALIIAVINNGLDLMGVSSYYQQVIKGTIIVLAVLLDTSRRARD